MMPPTGKTEEEAGWIEEWRAEDFRGENERGVKAKASAILCSLQNRKKVKRTRRTKGTDQRN
jgi:hypothetical protein